MLLNRKRGPILLILYHQSQVYERAPSFFALGAGLTLAPNGLAVIDQLGLLEKVRKTGSR
jgi:2-polyprenyl-6-methoxyphenol hydroxylase-like FAD-dependent oxidoreductase